MIVSRSPSERPSSNRVRIVDVAAAAGVSIATVSKALNGSGRMAPETRERVRRIASELEFRPNVMARALLSRRSFTIGLLAGDPDGSISMPVARGVAEATLADGVSVFYCAASHDPTVARKHVEAMLDKHVDGLLVVGEALEAPFPIDLSALALPVVHVLSAGPPDGIVFAPDEGEAFRRTLQDLRTAGRQRPVYLAGPSVSVACRQRALAFRAAAGWDAPVLFGAVSELWGRMEVDRLWQSVEHLPDAVLCGATPIAQGALAALAEHGVRVPADVAVATFGDGDPPPHVTLMDPDLEALGAAAARALLEMIGETEVRPGRYLIPCRIVPPGAACNTASGGAVQDVTARSAGDRRGAPSVA